MNDRVEEAKEAIDGDVTWWKRQNTNEQMMFKVVVAFCVGFGLGAFFV